MGKPRPPSWKLEDEESGRKKKKGPRPPSLPRDAPQSRHSPTPPTSRRHQPSPPSKPKRGAIPTATAVDDDDDDFDHDRERGKVKGQKPKKLERRDSSLSLERERKRYQKGHGDEFDENRKRIQVKKYQHKDYKGEVPTRENNYLGRTMSQVLRGEDIDLPDLDEIFYEPEHEALLKQKADGFWAKLVLTYRRKAAEKKALPRALLCALAVALLWASSVSACILVVNTFIRTPTYTEVETAILRLADTVFLESDLYDACVESQFTLCNSAYNTDKAVEDNRIISLQEENNRIIDQANRDISFCTGRFSVLLNKLTEYSLNGLEFTDFPTSGTPPPEFDCDAISTLAADQIAALLAVNAAQESGSNASNVIQEYRDQLNARVEYDIAYQANISGAYADDAERLRAGLVDPEDFAAQTELEVANFEACVTGEGVFVNSTNETIFCDDQSLVGTTTEFVNELGNEVNNLNQQGQEYVDQVNEIIADYNRLVNLVPDLITDLIVPDIPNLGQLEILFGVDLGDLGITEELYETALDAATEAVKGNFSAVEAELAAVNAEIEERQKNFSDSLDEFDPPGIDADLDLSAEQAIANAENLQGSIAQELGTLDFDEEDIPDISNITQFANSTIANLIGGLADRSLDLFAYSADIFTEIEVSFDVLFRLVFVFDSIWRVLQSILLVRRYWKISAFATPPGDCRAAKGSLFREKQGVLTAVGLLFYNPLVSQIYSLLVILVLSLAFYVAYIPLFDEYVKGCTQFNAAQIVAGESSGTMIFRNALSVTTLFATLSGDASHAEFVDSLNTRRVLECRASFEESSAVRTNQNVTFQQQKEDLDLHNFNFGSFAACIDFAAFDAQVNSFNPNVVEPLPFTFAEGFSVPNCTDPIPQITVSDEALYNCDEVQDCTVVCDNPNDVVLAQENFEAACETENALHSYFLTGLFASVMFMCLNISRYYFLRGILEVAWPSLTIDIYAYMVSCTERGTIIPPEAVENGEPFQSVIKKSLDKSLGKFTKKGYRDLGYALSINLPWMIFIGVISRNIDFNAGALN